MVADVAIALAAFAFGVGLAELLGAANLGTALGVGQIAFVLALCWRLLRPDPRHARRRARPSRRPAAAPRSEGRSAS